MISGGQASRGGKENPGGLHIYDISGFLQTAQVSVFTISSDKVSSRKELP
jgi:hypothetical protein